MRGIDPPRRQGGETGGLVRLYRDLLEEALAGLPPEIDRLVIVPDGTLHGASFAALRAEATEPTLESAALSRCGVLHLAAHAVIDDEMPDRSTVALAPGRPDEDGLLQIREILRLDLDGRVVLLSGCRSASGGVIPGRASWAWPAGSSRQEPGRWSGAPGPCATARVTDP